MDLGGVGKAGADQHFALLRMPVGKQGRAKLSVALERLGQLGRNGRDAFDG